MPEAARRLHYTQPTVSQHVTALERAIGAPLFDHEQHLSLTGDGERVLTLAGQILSLAAALPVDPGPFAGAHAATASRPTCSAS
jgi:DNA-binding transcriptional LysR family regulator